MPAPAVLDVLEATPVEKELGGSDVVIVRGDVFNRQDYVPELQGERAMLQWEEMQCSDAQIDGAYFNLTAPIYSSNWTMFPATSERDKNDTPISSKRDLEVADYARRWTLDYDLLQDGSGFAGLLEEFCNYTIYGFYAGERVWGVTKDNDQIVAKIAIRHPKSVQKFHLDENRRLEYIEQWAYTNEGFGRFKIPASRLVTVHNRKQSDNWWGRSLLRSCYLPWSIWRNLAIIDSMRHERHGMGIPVLEVPQGAGKTQMEQAKQVVKELRAHERQYIKLPPGFKLTWYFPAGQGTDIIGSMRYWDELKVRALHAEIINLGGANMGGNRSLGQTKERAMLLAVQGIANRLALMLNEGVVARNVRHKYGDDTPLPRLGVEDLDAMDISALAGSLKDLRAGDFFTPDDRLEVFLRKKIKFPAMDPDTARHKMPMLALGPGEDIDPKEKTEQEKFRERRRELILSGRAHVRTFGLSRQPMEHEKWCAFEEIVDYFDEEPKKIYEDVVEPIRKAQMKEIVSAVTKATTKELSTGSVRRPKKGQLESQVFAALKEAHVRGRKSIAAEMKAQRAGSAASRPATAGERPVIMLASVTQPSAADLAKVRRLAEMFAELTTEDMVKRAIQVAVAVRNAGLADAAVAARVHEALLALSEAVVTANLSGSLVASFTGGRNDAAAAAKDEVQTAFYSAIMDDRTCEFCAALDAEEHSPFNPEFVTPNPSCEGGLRCRCVTVYVFREEAA